MQVVVLRALGHNIYLVYEIAMRSTIDRSIAIFYCIYFDVHVLDLSSASEIAYVLDTSDDVGADDMVKMTDFVKNELKQHLPLSKVALVNFGFDVAIETALTGNEKELLDKLDNWKKLGGVRRFDLALQRIRDNVLTGTFDRVPVQQIVLVTSGRIPNSKKVSTLVAAKQLKENENVKISVVGIGDQVDKAELGKVSSNKGSLVLVDSFDKMPSVVDDVFAITAHNAGMCFLISLFLKNADSLLNTAIFFYHFVFLQVYLTLLFVRIYCSLR